MSTAPSRMIRPEVPLCCSFSVEVNNKKYELPSWQKVIIVVTGFLSFGIVGLTLSYYWRKRLVDQLYAEECKKVHNLFQAKVLKTDAPQRPPAKHFDMPKKISDIMATVSPLVSFLEPISREKNLYVDQEHSRLFCFNAENVGGIIELPKFLFDAIPPGIYFVVYAATPRIAEKLNQTAYENLARLIGEEADEVIDLIIGHFAIRGDLISNPKTHTKPWFKPSRICQILCCGKDNIKGWEAIYFGGSNDSGHLMSDTITKFTKTWVAPSEKAANEKRRLAAQRGIAKLLG